LWHEYKKVGKWREILENLPAEVTAACLAARFFFPNRFTSDVGLRIFFYE
jgi:hypothetical protein